VESSAYITIVECLTIKGKSFVKIKYGKGPRQLPWGTPQCIVIVDEY